MFGIDYKVLLNGSGISGDQEDRLNELAKEGYRLVAVGPKGFLFLERNKDAFELFNLIRRFWKWFTTPNPKNNFVHGHGRRPTNPPPPPKVSLRPPAEPGRGGYLVPRQGEFVEPYRFPVQSTAEQMAAIEAAWKESGESSFFQWMIRQQEAEK